MPATWGVLGDIMRDGFIGAVSEDAERTAVFVLLILGVQFMLIGVVTRWVQRRTRTVPESMGWVALIVSLLGVLAVPASGFWLAAALTGYGIVVSRQDAALPASRDAETSRSAERTSSDTGTAGSGR